MPQISQRERLQQPLENTRHFVKTVGISRTVWSNAPGGNEPAKRISWENSSRWNVADTIGNVVALWHSLKWLCAELSLDVFMSCFMKTTKDKNIVSLLKCRKLKLKKASRTRINCYGTLLTSRFACTTTSASSSIPAFVKPRFGDSAEGICAKNVLVTPSMQI